MASVLENRYATEPDVIQATARPRALAMLELIAAHPRWSTRPSVRSALLRHPALPRAWRSGCSAGRAWMTCAGYGIRRYERPPAGVRGRVLADRLAGV